MNKLIACLALLLVHSAWAQIDVPVVGNKDGQWRIINEGKEILLPRSVHYVNHFDKKGLAYYKENNKAGIINAKGEIIHEPLFRDIKLLGEGIYHCYSDKGQQIVDFSSPDFTTIDCISAFRQDEKWYAIRNKEGYQIFNYESKELIPIDSLESILYSGFGYIVINKGDTLSEVYNTAGEKFLVNPWRETMYLDYCFAIRTDSIKRIVYQSHTYFLEEDAKIAFLGEDTVVYSQGGYSYWKMAQTGKHIKKIPFDETYRLDPKLMAVSKNGKWGLYHNDKGLIAPTIYDALYDLSGEEGADIIVWKNGLRGILDRGGRVIVPCKYDYIIDHTEYYQVINTSNLRGVISRVTGKTILPCIYDYIHMKDGEVRGQSGDKLKIVKLDSKHKVLSNVTIKNAIQLQTRERYRRNSSIDNRLFALGWFTETQKKFDRNDFFTGYVDNWGFKNANDSILVKAKHAMPKFIPGADFTLVPHDSVDYGMSGLNRRMKAFSTTGNKRANMILPEMIFGIDSLDFAKRGFARLSSSLGMGVITPNGKSRYFKFVGREQGDFIRYCETGELVATDASDVEALQYPNLELVDDDYLRDGPPKTSETWKYDGDDFTFIKFEEAKWNFLDLTGEPLFNEGFDFVNEFEKKRSIAKRNGKWGLISPDTTMTAFRYSAMSRVSELGDTVFQVQVSSGGSMFLDTNSVELPLNIKAFSKTIGPLTQVIVGREKRILDANYKVVSGDTRTQKLMEGAWFYSKSRKVVSIYDEEGMSLGEYDLKPIERLGEDAFLFKKGSRYGVINSSGEEVIPFRYKKIIKTGNFYFAEDGSENLLFDDEFKLVKNCKLSQAIADEVSGNYAIISGSVIKVYNGETKKKISKFTGRKVAVFHNNWFFFTGKFSTARNLNGDVVKLGAEVEEIEILDDYGYLIKLKSRESKFFDSKLEEVTIGEYTKKSRYLGHGFVTSRYTNGVVVFNDENWIKFKKGSEVLGSFDDTYILIKEEGKYFYLNKELKNPFDRFFIGASPFTGNHASVKEREGWVIIDINGVFKTLPNYSGMKHVGPNLFSVPSFTLYGLIDNNGNDILAPIYKKITFINSNLIQVIHEGEIKYFNAKGVELKIYE